MADQSNSLEMRDLARRLEEVEQQLKDEKRKTEQQLKDALM